MKIPYKLAIIISLLCAIASLGYNELNLHYLKQDHPELVSEGNTVRTSDDMSYLIPPLNWLKGKGWRDNSLGKRAFFLRPPGYGMWYSLFVTCFGENLSLQYMKFAQVFLFFLSCIALFLMVFFLLRSQTVAIITTLIYGSTPVGCGFLYYSISESITPAILIIGVFLSLNTFHFVTIKNRLFFIILSAVFMAFLIIVRPVLLLFTIFPPLIILLQKDSIIKRKILSSICTLVIILLPISLWQLRNYKISNQWVGLHPIYYPESNSLFTPAHGAVWNFASAYGTKPAVFHGYMVPLWDNTINGDTSQKIINDILTTIPRDVRMSLGEENIYSALLKYRSFLILQKNYLDNNKALPVQLPDKEIEAITAFNTLTNAYKRQFFFHYYVLTPLSVIGDMCCNSNLSMYMFQKSFRGNTIMELFRWIATGLRLICFILVIPALFFYKKIPEKLLFGLFPLLYILFLAMVIRGVEERYLLPIWPLLIINFGMFVQLIYSRYFVKTKEEPL